MKYKVPLSQHPPLYVGPQPDEARIRATIKNIQQQQEQEIVTSIFQQARTNIARCPTTQTPQHYMSEHNRNVETIRKSLHSKGPKGKVPPTWKPKDLDESISSSSKHDTTYFVHEAARQLKTRVKNPSEEERFYAAKQNSPGGAGLESEGGAPQHRREETSGVQKNVLDVSRDPRLHRR